MSDSLAAPLLALCAALFFGIAQVLLKRALVYSKPLISAAISVTATAACVWVLAGVHDSPALIFDEKIIPFLLAGLVAPALARLLLIVGLQRIGVSRSSSLVATAPLFAVAIAIFALSERPSPALLIGIVAVVAGTVLLALRNAGENHWQRRDLMLPILAAFGFAVRDVLSRYGLEGFPHPVVGGAAITTTSTVVLWIFVSVWHANGRPDLNWRGVSFVVASGVSEGIAYGLLLNALAIGSVSVVSPLIHAQGLFTVMLAAIFLRDLERVTWRTVLATCLIIAGVLVVIHFRA